MGPHLSWAEGTGQSGWPNRHCRRIVWKIYIKWSEFITPHVAIMAEWSVHYGCLGRRVSCSRSGTTVPNTFFEVLDRCHHTTYKSCHMVSRPTLYFLLDRWVLYTFSTSSYPLKSPGHARQPCGQSSWKKPYYATTVSMLGPQSSQTSTWVVLLSQLMIT